MKPQTSLKKSPGKPPAERMVKDIRRQTRRHFSAEDKIRIVLDGLRGEDSIAELCRKEGIAQSLYYTWSKEFMEAGKRRLAGDTARAATTGEVQDLRRETRALKECVADLTLENRLLKKASSRMGATTNEVSRIREARDHQDRRAVAPVRQANAGPARHRPPDLLPLVRPLPRRRPGGAGGSAIDTGPGVESHCA
jgi:transposase